MGKVVRVAIGGAGVGRGDDQIITVVGSCVAIMLYDKKLKIGGMAHIMLGHAKNDHSSPAKYADTGVPYLIKLMVAQGASPKRLVGAKIAGGGVMFPTAIKNNVAVGNVIAVKEVLEEHGIQIIASDCGDTLGRRVTFSIENGKVLVQMQGKVDKIL